MQATKALRSMVGQAERTPMIRFKGKRTTPAHRDHTPHPHPASSSSLPSDFAAIQSQASSSPTFSSYRQTAQQHGPLARAAFTVGTGSLCGRSLGPVEPREKGVAFDTSELPAKFWRGSIDMSEIDAIETGGATMVC